MTATLAIVAYLALAAVMWTRVYRWLYRTHRRDFPSLDWDDKDRAFGVVWGGLVALFWPIFGPIAGVIWLSTRPPLVDALRRLETDGEASA